MEITYLWPPWLRGSYHLRSKSGAPCQTDDNLVFANQHHTNNHCIVQGGNESTLYKGCCGAKPAKCDAAGLAAHFYRTADNTIYTNGVPGPSMAPLFKDASGECAGGWAGWQVRKTPSDGPEVGPTSAFSSCVPTGMHGPTRCIFWGFGPS
jgi:hypothetical protein